MNASAVPITRDSSSGKGISKGVLIALLALCLAAVGAVVFLIIRPGSPAPEVILAVTEAHSPEEAGIPALTVVDTIQNPSAEAVVGGRYKVRITDNAREGSSGIARIGGRVTFVPDTRKGDVAVIEVTRLKRTTADAALIERVAGAPALAPEPASASPVPPSAARETGGPTTTPASGLMGQTFRGTVEALGKEGDGIVKVNGKTVFIKGTSVGQHVEFRITGDRARIALGELLQVLPPPETPTTVPAAPDTTPADSTPDPVSTPAPASPTPAPADAAQAPMPAIGSEHVVMVSEKDRRDPDKNGVARIHRLVVFVPGTQPGDRVRIRIVEHMRRAVRAEVIERLPPEAPTQAPPAS